MFVFGSSTTGAKPFEFRLVMNGGFFEVCSDTDFGFVGNGELFEVQGYLPRIGASSDLLGYMFSENTSESIP